MRLAGWSGRRASTSASQFWLRRRVIPNVTLRHQRAPRAIRLKA